MADLSNLSNSQLESLLQSAGIPLRSPENGFDSLIRGFKETPQTLGNLPSGLYNLGGDVVDLVTFNNSPEKAQNTLKSVGTIASGTAGGLSGAAAGATAGATIGSIVPIVGTAAGGVLGALIGGLGGGALASRGYEYLADLIMGKDTPTKQKVVNDLSYDLGQGLLIDGLTFGAGRGLRTIGKFADEVADTARLGTKAGRDVKTAQALRAVGVDENALAKVNPNDARSIGEQLQDPTLARVETALNKEYGLEVGPQASERMAARQDMRQSLLDSPDVSKLEAGTEMYADLANQKAFKSGEVSRAYKAVPGKTRLNIKPVIRRIDDVLNKYLGEGAIEKLSPEVERIVLDLIDNAEDISVERLNNYRKTLGNQLSHNMPDGLNKEMAAEIRDAIDSEAAAANTGLDKAVQARREMGQQFEQGATGKILKEKKYGERVTLDSQVAEKVLASPEAAMQYSAVADEAGREALTNYVKTNIRNLMQADKLGQAVSYYAKRADQLKSILDPEQFAEVTQAVKDVESQLGYGRLAKQPSRGESGTAQFTADQAGLKKLFGVDSTFIDKHPILTKGGGALLGSVLGGKITNLGGSFFGTVIGLEIGQKVIQALKNADTEIAGQLYRALTDKAYAAELLAKAGNGDTWAMGAIRTLDGMVDKAAELSGVKDLSTKLKTSPANLLVPGITSPVQSIGERGTQHQQELDRYNRVDNIANTLSEIDDGTLLKLLRENGINMSKKKDNTMSQSNLGMPQTVTDELLDAVRQVESGGGKYLESPVGAKGPYQLMDATGKRIHKMLGIKEPYDPYNEQQAREIARYHLQDGLKRFGTMELALADYNAGNPAVLKAVKKAETKNFDTLAQYLPSETAAYVPKVYRALVDSKV